MTRGQVDYTGADATHNIFAIGITEADAVAASEIPLVDSGAWTSADDVEEVIAEVLSRLPITKVLTSDFDADDGTTGATPTATSLSLTVKANKTYIVRAVLVVTATTNGGIEVSFAAPGSSTFSYTALLNPADDVLVQRTAGGVANPINYIATALSSDPLLIEGVLTTDSAGSFTIKGAQDTAHEDNTLIKAGSSLLLIPVV